MKVYVVGAALGTVTCNGYCILCGYSSMEKAKDYVESLRRLKDDTKNVYPASFLGSVFSTKNPPEFGIDKDDLLTPEIYNENDDEIIYKLGNSGFGKLISINEIVIDEDAEL